MNETERRTAYAALCVQTLQALSKSRAARWHDNPQANWSLLEWAGAMCGEAGEAANFAKKIKRIESQMRNIETHTAPEHRDYTIEKSAQMALADYKRALAKEVADAILYGMCIFNELGADAEHVIRQVFNEKSEEYGFPERV